MKYRVELSGRAERDVDHIIGYIAKRSLAGAASWAERWRRATREIGALAEACQIAPENIDHAEEIRHYVFKTKRGLKYRAIFLIRGETAFITHVRGPGQDVVAPGEFDL